MFLIQIPRAFFALALLVNAAAAQTAENNDIATSSAELSIPDLQFKSAFSDYVPYKEQAIESWRQANDTVGAIGGWKTYAKEAHQPDRSQVQPGLNDSMQANPESKGVK